MCSKQFFLSFLLSQQVLLPTLFASGWIEDRFTASTKNPECQLGVFFFCVETCSTALSFVNNIVPRAFWIVKFYYQLLYAALFYFTKKIGTVNSFAQMCATSYCNLVFIQMPPILSVQYWGLHIKILKLQPFFQFMRLLLSHPHNFKEHRKLTMQNNSLD